MSIRSRRRHRQRKDNARAYNAGYAAWFAGQRRSANPFDYGTSEYSNWDAGFVDARDGFKANPSGGALVGWIAVALALVAGLGLSTVQAPAEGP
jgi:hypothetical protein